MKITINDQFKGMTIEELLRHWVLPKKMIHELRMSKALTVNSQPALFATQLHTGDVLELPVAEEHSQYKSSHRLCEVVYEDDYLAVLVKPKGVKTHPNDMMETNTLLNHAVYTLKSDYVEPIHRLDQETVGLVLVAKNPLIKKILDRMLEQREITRTYKAKVRSLLPIKNQTIELPIGKDKFHPNKRRVSDTGQHAVTHIISSQVLGDGVTEVELKLDTGRTHQIRVHLAAIGHPVLGDPLYSDSKLRQLQLTGYKLSFIHPFTGELVQAELKQ
ncbi:RluA family pseudouridine synthase [Macrococcus equipercicus]|uniref:Pseudouridine synthase n=1 Tax=Macrococcus equipercicus TaxID=69967 RepID=A0A9Q9BLG9_9STAP|nr:RluA family pseudouridine synthase [Macrococcus equipercicus]KAA1039179.1 RluA family pseudouridine synthase [Macrococcus equipercicus]UTH13355.1 RluA family pseudouridine synthase [Macrococcus equipercicus]